MSADQVFSIVTPAVLPAWLLLVLLPRWQWTARLINAAIVPGLLGILYLVLAVTHFSDSGGGFGTLAEVRTLFESPWALLAGWIHYLAFDLFVGAWEVRDAQTLGIHHLWVVPCLFLTFMFGPVGLLFYLALRLALRRTLLVGEPLVATSTSAET